MSQRGGFFDEVDRPRPSGWCASHSLTLPCPRCDVPPLEFAHARRTDPETSHAAAASLSPETLRASQAAVLAKLRELGPVPDVDLVEAMRGAMSSSGTRTRRKELAEKGLVSDTGKRVRLPSNRLAIVWSAAGLPCSPEGHSLNG